MIRPTQIILLILLLFPCHAFSSQSPSDYQIPSSYQPVGSGARAIGMGGAFIGIADDATAASWNPGGLVQLEKSEVSIVGAFLRRKEDFSFERSDFFSASQSINFDSLNYFSLAYCFSFLQRNMVVSLNYQNLYDFNREWHFPIPFISETPGLNVDMNVDFVSQGKLSALGLAYSVELHPKFSFGITFNYWEDDFYQNAWETTTVSKTIAKTASMTDATVIESRYRYRMDNGFNTNIGFLWNITPSLSLGGVYKARFTADLSQKSSTQTIHTTLFHDNPAMNSDTTSLKIDEQHNELKLPMSYGMGLAWKITSLLTVSMDIYRTEWDEFVIKTQQGEFSPLFSLPSDDTFTIPSSIPTIKPTHQVRIGTEYLTVNKKYQLIVPFRAGFFYDPVPGKGAPDKAWGFSLGSGFSKSPYNFDIAFQYRQGNNLGEDFTIGDINSFDINESILYTSFIYHF
ncbi:MAG: outer membrane protein transport protein [Candidatus Magnetomorum sp.]|nr:outer membrane protein transport protein [Candidatus Magnetomorum sp.]